MAVQCQAPKADIKRTSPFSYFPGNRIIGRPCLPRAICQFHHRVLQCDVSYALPAQTDTATQQALPTMDAASSSYRRCQPVTGAAGRDTSCGRRVYARQLACNSPEGDIVQNIALVLFFLCDCLFPSDYMYHCLYTRVTVSSRPNPLDVCSSVPTLCNVLWW